MTKSILGFLAVALIVSASGGVAPAAFTTTSTVSGSALAGANYATFDALPTGTTGGTSNGVAVAFAGPNAGAVTGAASGLYAAPDLSGQNNLFFGPVTTGADATTYLTTGTGTVTLTFQGGPIAYLGLLWGSVDNGNVLTFFNGTTNLGSITGADVLASANGNQGTVGTTYVNIASTVAFTSVVATSAANAFEFDNVAYGVVAVPEPSSLALCCVAGLSGLAVARARRKRA